MSSRKIDELEVEIFSSPRELAMHAASAFARAVLRGLTYQAEITALVSTGNSQLDFLAALRDQEIDWSRVSIVVADEYVGLPEAHPSCLRHVMQKHLIDHVKPKAFYPIHGDFEPIEAEVERYSALIRGLRPYVGVLGIGENGHLGFNDPPADFASAETVRIQELDQECRMQQVGEGHFESLEATPRFGLTQSIPTLLACREVLVVVPEKRKAAAVRNALEGPVTENCPASILRRQPHARLYLDQESSSMLSAV